MSSYVVGAQHCLDARLVPFDTDAVREVDDQTHRRAPTHTGRQHRGSPNSANTTCLEKRRPRHVAFAHPPLDYSGRQPPPRSCMGGQDGGFPDIACPARTSCAPVRCAQGCLAGVMGSVCQPSLWHAAGALAQTRPSKPSGGELPWGFSKIVHHGCWRQCSSPWGSRGTTMCEGDFASTSGCDIRRTGVTGQSNERAWGPPWRPAHGSCMTATSQ